MSNYELGRIDSEIARLRREKAELVEALEKIAACSTTPISIARAALRSANKDKPEAER